MASNRIETLTKSQIYYPNVYLLIQTLPKAFSIGKSPKIKSIPILSSGNAHPAFLIQQCPKIKGATRNRTQRATFELSWNISTVSSTLIYQRYTDLYHTGCICFFHYKRPERPAFASNNISISRRGCQPYTLPKWFSRKPIGWARLQRNALDIRNLRSTKTGIAMPDGKEAGWKETDMKMWRHEYCMRERPVSIIRARMK